MLCLFISIAQITPQTLKSRSNQSRPSDYKSCLFISIPQITPQTLKSRSNHTPDLQITSLACSFRSMRSLPRRSNHAEITLQTLRWQVLVHFDYPDHSPDAKITLKSQSRPSHYKCCLFISIAQITFQTLKSTLNHTPNPYFTLKCPYPTMFYQVYLIKVN